MYIAIQDKFAWPDSLIFPGTVIGFSSTTYTGSETSRNVSVCVEILNPPSGVAAQPFNATLIEAQGLVQLYPIISTYYYGDYF